MTPETLSAIAAGLLSLVLAYVPGVRERFAALATDQRRAVVGALILVSAIGALGATCANVYVTVTCDPDGVNVLVRCVIAALVSNQGTYTLLVKGRV